METPQFAKATSVFASDIQLEIGRWPREITIRNQPAIKQSVTTDNEGDVLYATYMTALGPIQVIND